MKDEYQELYRSLFAKPDVYVEIIKALTLMIAESRTEEKDTMVKVIVNLINKNN